MKSNPNAQIALSLSAGGVAICVLLIASGFAARKILPDLPHKGIPLSSPLIVLMAYVSVIIVSSIMVIGCFLMAGWSLSRRQ